MTAFHVLVSCRAALFLDFPLIIYLLQPSVDIRTAIRRDQLIPLIIDLLDVESDHVVGAAAIALRNLAVDQQNKELIGRIKVLCASFPQLCFKRS